MLFIGNDWTKDTISGQFTIADALAAFVITTNMGILFLNFRNIYKHQKREIVENEITGEPLITSGLIVQINGYLIPQLLLGGLQFIGPHPLINNAVKGNSANPLFFGLLLQCFLMQHLTCSIQVNHVSKYQYSPFNNRLNIVIIVYTIGLYMAVFFLGSKVDVLSNIYIMLAATVLCQWHFILNVVSEMAQALGIPVLRIKSQ